MARSLGVCPRGLRALIHSRKRALVAREICTRPALICQCQECESRGGSGRSVGGGVSLPVWTCLSKSSVHLCRKNTASICTQVCFVCFTFSCIEPTRATGLCSAQRLIQMLCAPLTPVPPGMWRVFSLLPGQGSCLQSEEHLSLQINLSARGDRPADLDKLKPYVIEHIVVLLMAPTVGLAAAGQSGWPL